MQRNTKITQEERRQTMSTRCQIEFKTERTYEDKNGEKQTKTDRRTVYRHSDGYPEGVIPDLKKFLEWNKSRNDDIEYAVANFIYWSKKDMNAKYQEEHTGFGVCANDELHSDTAFYYVVLLKETEIVIECYNITGTYEEPKIGELLQTEKVKQ